MAGFLHVLNGSSAAGTLNDSGIPGKITPWAESLIEGPIPRDASDEEWRQVRAHYYASQGWGSVAKNLRQLAMWDEPLARFRGFDEVVLWFEHDLFDQLLLIRHLHWFSRRDLGATRLSLICINAFPGKPRFGGLGELSAPELATLFGTQKPITAEQFQLGSAAWAAFSSPDPHEIEKVLASDTSALPFLAKALRRHLAEFPSTRNGLSMTESLSLNALAIAPTNPVRLFIEIVNAREDKFMGDMTFFGILQSLASGPNPLIETVSGLPASTPLEFRRSEHRLTELGRKVVAGEADRVADCGIDRHLGGVYLIGHEIAWRWDAEAGRIA